jgi:peptidoglycan/LPS O-acetylase OafA/YrhL
MERNRYADLLRVVAIGGVVYGHWLLVSVTYRGGQLSGVDALNYIQWGRWVTWAFQVMPVFFLVGGYVNVQSWRAHHAAGETWTWWVRDRAMRLLWPTAVFVVVAVIAVVVAQAAGAPTAELAAAGWLIALQLWFLPVYLVLIALTPLMYAAHRRWGLAVPAVMAAAAGLVDVGVTGPHLHVIGYLNYLFVWGSIHQWGFFWQDGSLTSARWRPYVLAAGGAALLAGLVTSRSFSPDMVGSGNTNPPSIALLAYAAAQAGLVLAIEPWATRLLSHERLWRPVRRLNAVVMNVYLWHFVPAIVIAVACYPTGLLPQPAVGSAEWFELRLVWFALLTAVLAPLVVGVTRAERPMLRLPAGLGRPGPWSPLLLLAGLVVAAVGLVRLAIGGFAPDGRLPGLVLAAFAAGLAATLFTGRAPAEGMRQRALPPDLPEHPASSPRPVGSASA